MRTKIGAISTSAIRAAVAYFLFGALVAHSAYVDDLNASAVLNKMNSDQRHGYISGVVEGLAYARFLRDRPNETGMKCIYDWYYTGKIKKWLKIEAWFKRHPDKPVGALLYVLTKKECGA